MNVIAIIPARGGSKRIPGKNIIPLLGVPLIEHTIRHARASKYINRVIVSTDDKEIMYASWRASAGTVKRPDEISGDHDQPESALIYTLDYIETTYGDVVDLVVFLQCTSPIRRTGDIDNAIETLLKSHAEALFTSTQVSHFVLFDGYGNWLFDKQVRKRSQDRKPALLEDGSFYVIKPWVLREHEDRLGKGKVRVTHYPLPWWCGLEIDDEEDLETCEVIMKWKRDELAWFPD